MENGVEAANNTSLFAMKKLSYTQHTATQQGYSRLMGCVCCVDSQTNLYGFYYCVTCVCVE